MVNIKRHTPLNQPRGEVPARLPRSFKACNVPVTLHCEYDKFIVLKEIRDRVIF